MANVKPTYLKLNPKSAFFYDPATGLEVHPGEVVSIDLEKAKALGKKSLIDDAVRGGHLQYSNEEEYKKYKATKGEEAELADADMASSNLQRDTNEDVGEKNKLVEQAKNLGTTFGRQKLKRMTDDELKKHIQELKSSI
jgi:hypothetical protein